MITAIDNGYKLVGYSMDAIESVELLPVWRVKIKGEAEPVYISANDLKDN